MVGFLAHSIGKTLIEAFIMWQMLTYELDLDPLI